MRALRAVRPRRRRGDTRLLVGDRPVRLGRRSAGEKTGSARGTRVPLRRHHRRRVRPQRGGSIGRVRSARGELVALERVASWNGGIRGWGENQRL